MEFKPKFVAWFFLVMLSVLVWAFFLNASGLGLTEAINIANFEETLRKIMSLEFLLLVLVFPITYSLVVVMAKAEGRIATYIITFLSLIFAGMLSLALFPKLLEFLALGMLYIISFFLVIEIAMLKFQELKAFVMVRSAGDSIGKSITVLGIGLFVLISFTVLANQEEFVKGFEDKVFSLAAGDSSEMNLEGLSADLIAGTQLQTIQQIKGMQQYQPLTGKDDVEVQTFLLAINELEEVVGSQQYREQLKENIRRESGNSQPAERFRSTFETIKSQIPFFVLIEKYFWLITAISFTSIFFLVGGIIIKPLGMLYAGLFDLVLSLISPKVTAEQKLREAE
ncbi:MAG: hypothetical protein J4224_03355 [Candidatus Diapherotrites archaeon]|uniref:Uncharacterized protein n=1 Tax=Candidatus Iainarchaeum sp. TaxID=3101447 RepID=A0A8T4L928_9ARCH|nr:hypothetical protein [Candidatus Diapherotrites archaeon]